MAKTRCHVVTVGSVRVSSSSGRSSIKQFDKM